MSLHLFVSYAVFFLVLGSFYLSSKAVIKINGHLIRWNDIAPIVMIGIPGALVTFCLAIRGVTLNALLLETAGNDGLSALAALNSFGYLFYASAVGFGYAVIHSAH